jgi:hypothetical protein
MKGWLKVILISIGIFFVLMSLVFFLAGLSPEINAMFLIEGVVILIFGISPIAVVIYLEKKESQRPVNVTQNIEINSNDLVGGERNVKEIRCNSCSAPLSSSDIRITDLGVMVKCPYCGSAYVVEEEPKW